MKILAVETATSLQSVALLDGSSVVASSTADASQSHVKHLIPMIDRLLLTTGWTLTTLEGLAISIGPGSFTGLRVGLATMLGFRSVTKLPLVAVPTLEGLCWNMHMADRPICSVLRARPGEVYWAQYRWAGSGRLEPLGTEQVGSLESLIQSLDGATIVVGDGWQVNHDQFRRLLGARALDVIEASPEKMGASAVSIGLAGFEMLRKGRVAEHSIAPRYVQRAEAEIVWERRSVSGVTLKVGKLQSRRLKV